MHALAVLTRRWLPAAILVAGGSIVAPKPAEHGLFQRGAATIAGSLLIGAAFSVALLLLVGGVLAAVSRNSRRGRKALISGTTVALAAGLLAASATARLLIGGGARTGAAPGVAATRRTAEARAWSLRVSGLVVALRAPWRAEHSLLTHPSNTARLRRAAALERARTSAAVRRLRAVRVPPIPAIVAAQRQLLRFATFMLYGYDDLVVALAENARADKPLAHDPVAARSLDRARTSSKRARAVGLARGPRLYALNRLFYGS
jgi:hypothetical protein